MIDETLPTKTSVTVPFETLQALFDLAVNSMNFSSGFWDSDDVTVARAIAVILGVDPKVATPQEFMNQYPHEFKSCVGVTCRLCESPEDHSLRSSEGESSS